MQKTTLILTFILTTLIYKPCISQSFIPQNGDLMFQVAGTSNFSKAISDATGGKDSLLFDHVGIVSVENNQTYIIEASAKNGVICTPLQEYIASSAKVNDKPGIVVMRVNINFPINDAVARAKKHIGEAYDWSYYPDNGKMYCSELVYTSYCFADTQHLFTAKPMNFRDAQGNFPQFWIQLFNELGEKIPQGIPGTNPNDLAREPSLSEVYRYF